MLATIKTAWAIKRSPVRMNPPKAPTGREPIRVEPELPRRAFNFEELEAWRGIAAIMIVIFHVYQFSREATHQPRYLYEGTPLHNVLANLEVGVAWFFALSGFLLFLPIARACLRKQGRPSTRGFLIRRAIRILPLYYTAIIVVWTWRFSGRSDQWHDLFNHLTFTHNFSDQQMFWTIGPAWSLAVEVHFYIALGVVAPAIYAICRLLPGELLRFAFLIVLVAVLWLGGTGYLWWAEYVAGIPHNRPSMYFNLPSRLDNFAVGMLLAVIVAKLKDGAEFNLLLIWVLRIVGFLGIAATFATRDYSSTPVAATWVNTYFHSLGAMAFTLIIASTVLRPRMSPWTWMLTRPWLQSLGLLSYGIYLWHEPILIEFGQRERLIRSDPGAFVWNAAILIALSVLVAWFTYRAVEFPALQMRYLFRPDGRFAERYKPLPPRQAAGETAPAAIAEPAQIQASALP